MLTIETINIVDEITGKDQKFIHIDGVIQKHLYYKKDGLLISGTVVDKQTIESLLNISFNEFNKYFEEINYSENIEGWEGIQGWIDINIVSNEIDLSYNVEEKYSNEILIFIRTILEEWNKPYSYSNVCDEFNRVFKSSDIDKDSFALYLDDVPEATEAGLYYYPVVGVPIKPEIILVKNAVLSLLKETEKNLIASIDKDTVLKYFQFPEEYKTAFKQYLIYFTEFMADIDIEVDTEIKEEANQTLFKIIPKDKNEGLDKIREALYIYLNAPGAKDFQSQTANNNDIAVWQWKANVSHLESQIMLANSVLQAKDATIQALQLSNYMLSQKVETNDSKKENEKEDLIPGIVQVGTLELYSVSIKFGEILKRLKRRFK